MCSPHGRTCIEEKSNFNFSCSVNSEGIYADIFKTQEEKVEIEEQAILQHGVRYHKAILKAKERISKLVNEYNSYKKSKLQNFRFNPAKSSSQFGKFCKGSCAYYVIADDYSIAYAVSSQMGTVLHSCGPPNDYGII